MSGVTLVPHAATAPRPAGAVGLTVAQALELPALAGARLAAGEAGARRGIRVANIMEVPDIIRWMRGGEFLLTTAYAVRDDEEALTGLVPELAARGLAALGVKVGPYLPRLPDPMLRRADELGFPIVELPGDVMLNDILSEVIGTVLNRQALSLERSQALRDRLSQAVLGGGSYGELVVLLAGRPAAPPRSVVRTGGCSRQRETCPTAFPRPCPGRSPSGIAAAARSSCGRGAAAYPTRSGEPPPTTWPAWPGCSPYRNAYWPSANAGTAPCC